MSTRSQDATSKKFAKDKATPPRHTLQQERDIESAALSNTEDHVEPVEEEGDFPGFVHSVDDDQRRPGAYAIAGIAGNLSFTSSEPSIAETGNVANEQEDVFIPEAQVVDEAAEAHLRQDYERLEQRIRQIESEAVVAIPVTVEDTARQEPSYTRSQEWNVVECFQNKRTRRCVISVVLVLVVAIVIGSVFGSLLGKGDDTQESTPSDQQTSSPTSRPSDQQTTSPTSTPKTQTLNQLGQTLNGEAGDMFGAAVALSANGVVLAAGGPFNDGGGNTSGHVQVFLYETGSRQWSQLGQNLTGRAKGDEIGSPVALSWDGSVLATGAFSDAESEGYVRVFTFKNDTAQWSQVGQDINGTAPGEFFGYSTALSADGTVVAAGGPGRRPIEELLKGTPELTNKTGYVKILTIDSTSSEWKQLGQVLNGTAVRDAYGLSVALSANGMVLAVGSGNGIVQVLRHNNNTNRWEQVGQNLYGEGFFDGFGFALDLSEDGTILAVGAPLNSGMSGSLSGHVRVFSHDHVINSWNQTGNDIDGESENNVFGFSVALSADGTVVAARSILHKGKGGEYSGQVRVFSYDNVADRWKQVGENLDGKGEGDFFGSSVALSQDGTIVAAGGPLNNETGSYAGHVRVFEVLETSS